MPANVDGMVREGISAYRAGKKDEARTFLLKAVEIDERNEQAWLWLSAVVESVDEQRICLENVLAINPNNERARQGLQMLAQKAAPPPQKADDVLAAASFAPPPPQPPAPAPKAPPAADADDELPSSIEWDAPPTASSSVSSTRRVDEPSAKEYDDWVSSLNLGAKASESLLGGIDDFAPPPPSAPRPPARTNMDAVAQFMSTSAFDDEEEEDLFGGDDGIRDLEDVFGAPAGPFSAETNLPPAAPRRDDPPKPAARAAASRPAPVTPPSRSDALLDDIEEDEEADEFISEFGDNFDTMTLEPADPSELFHYIPREITATRLPGTKERYPILVVLGLLVAVAANVGAVAFLVSRLTGA